MEKVICNLCRKKVFTSSPGYSQCRCGGRLVNYFERTKILVILREEGHCYMKGIRYESNDNF